MTGTQGEHAWVIKLTPLPAGGVVEGGKKKKLSKADEVGGVWGVLRCALDVDELFYTQHITFWVRPACCYTPR